MPDWLSIHEPVLVNTIGHCAGSVIFGMLLYFFLINWRRAREEGSRLPAIAAALALLWNIGSLIALATGPASGMTTVEGVTNSAGEALIKDILPGDCRISFPDLDAREWSA